MESLPKKLVGSEETWRRAEDQLRKMHGKNLSIKRVEEYSGSGRVYRLDDSLEFGYVFEGNVCLLFKLSEN